MGKTPRPSIEGTILDDLIALGFTDGDGDMVTNDGEDIFGFDGNDIIDAAGGADRVYGGIGNDTLFGGGGNDSVYGGEDDDEIHGGGGHDKLYGDHGNDLIFGDAGADTIVAGRGNDTVYGGNGRDKIYGNKGNNELYGGNGNDFISTGDQTSLADGGGGKDIFEVRAKKGGDHILTGGADADTFNFVQTGTVAVSDMTITDFELGLDDFTIEGIADSTYLNLIGPGAVTEVNGNALLTLTTGDTITFEGIDEATFEAFFGL